MRKLTLLTMLLTASLLGAAELTAETVAAPQATLIQQLTLALWAAFLSLAGSLLTWFASKGVPLLNAYLKSIMHFRGSEAVADSLTLAIDELAEEVKEALADGKITEAEKAALKIRARAIAKDKLERMTGFYKTDLIGWIDEVLDVELGKLLSKAYNALSSKMHL